MKSLTRRSFTAAGIIAALSAGTMLLEGCAAQGEGTPEDGQASTEREISEEEAAAAEDAYKPQRTSTPKLYGPPEDFDESSDAASTGQEPRSTDE